MYWCKRLTGLDQAHSDRRAAGAPLPWCGGTDGHLQLAVLSTIPALSPSFPSRGDFKKRVSPADADVGTVNTPAGWDLQGGPEEMADHQVMTTYSGWQVWPHERIANAIVPKTGKQACPNATISGEVVCSLSWVLKILDEPSAELSFSMGPSDEEFKNGSVKRLLVHAALRANQNSLLVVSLKTSPFNPATCLLLIPADPAFQASSGGGGVCTMRQRPARLRNLTGHRARKHSPRLQDKNTRIHKHPRANTTRSPGTTITRLTFKEKREEPTEISACATHRSRREYPPDPFVSRRHPEPENSS